MLLEASGFHVVAEAPDGPGAVQLARTHRPDVAVLDLSMPGLSGSDTARAILTESQGTAVVALSVHTEEHIVVAALRAGIRGYVVKTDASTSLIQAIHEVVAGRIYLSPKVSGVLIRAYLSGTGTAAGRLTPRERDVLRLVAEGKTAREVAERLRIAPKTAEICRARLMSKLDIQDTAGLVRYAIQEGLVDL